jgi:uncharacterized OB-fold protein
MTERVPAVEGWFTMDEAEPALVGARGVDSGSYFWPAAMAVSANPSAPFEEREPVLLSRVGTVWSWSTNHYQPPEPYVPNGPDGTFEPYTVVAVELEREQMVVLGPLATGADPALLKIGMTVELVLGPLFVEDGVEHTVWQWSPSLPRSAPPAGRAGQEGGR